MINTIVIADDLTGANATGVLLKKNNFNTYTALDERYLDDPSLQNCNCLVVPTNSRAIPPHEAYQRVRSVLERMKSDNIQLYSKRIDSTLRGNLGSETDAFLDVLGDDYMAVCVPCFPSSGRVLVGGYLLVNGIPLQNTEVARDPLCPMSTSSAKVIYLSQSKFDLTTIHLDDIANGVEFVADKFQQAREDGARIVVCDAVSVEDMEVIADALIYAQIPFVAVDPGVFTATVAKRILPKPEVSGTGKVLCAIGSVNGVARAQVKELLGDMDIFNVYLDVGEIFVCHERLEAEIDRVVSEILSEGDHYEYFSVIGSGIDPVKRIDFTKLMRRLNCTVEELTGKINDTFAEIIYRLLKARCDFRGVYSTGGDISAAVQKRMGTVGLRLLDEVVPLAGYSELVGGEFPGLKYISKGGMVGDDKAMVTCVRYLREKI